MQLFRLSTRTSLALFVYSLTIFVQTSILFAAKKSELILDKSAAWPIFRGNARNQGFSSFPANYNGDKPWSFQTAKGIFSTAIIDDQDNVYVGSADTHFYAIDPKGNLLWKLKTDEIIDSSALLTQEGQHTYLTIPSGDGNLYHLELQPDHTGSKQQIIWKFDAHNHPHPKKVGYTWFEGNVTLGAQGTLLAGNTNWNFYAINSHDGSLAWSFPSGNMNWSAAAIDERGDIYWTSLDRKIRKMSSIDGQVIWEQSTLGFNSSSAALDYEGRVFFGSFDSRVYALDQDTGNVIWKYKTSDHIYASPALSLDENNRLKRIYITSTDGKLYCLSPEGDLIWAYDTGSIIRSSPSLNQDPDGQDIIYFGAANGLLYAINGDGSFRWAFDSNSNKPDLMERNDLNSSPALSSNGLVIGGEHGFIWYIPYDYPFHHPEDPRSMLAMEPNKEGVSLQLMSSGWIERDSKQPIENFEPINIKVHYYRNGKRIRAGINGWHNATKVEISPSIPFKWDISGSGQDIYIQPLEPLAEDQSYEITVNGSLLTGGFNFGNLEIGASQKIPFTSQLKVRTARGKSSDELHKWFEMDTPKTFQLSRLSLPSPPMIASLNQIGFDSLHWLIRFLEVTPSEENDNKGKITAWLTEAFQDKSGENLTINKDSSVHAVLTGSYDGNNFLLKAKNLSLNVAGIDISLAELELRGRVNPGNINPQIVAVNARLDPFTDINYAPLLGLSGLVNSSFIIPISGNFLLSPYRENTKSHPPEGFDVVSMHLEKSTSLLGKKRYKVQLSTKGMQTSNLDFDTLTLVWIDKSTHFSQSTRIHEISRSPNNTWRLEAMVPVSAWIKTDTTVFYLLYNITPYVPKNIRN